MGIVPELCGEMLGYRWCCMWRDVGARIQR